LANLLQREAGCLNRLGELDEVEAVLARLRAQVKEDASPSAHGLVRGIEGGYLLARGQAEPAARAFREAVSYYERGGFRRGSAFGRTFLANSLMAVGGFSEAAALLSEVVEIQGGRDFVSAAAFTYRARAYLGLGLVEEARGDAETGLTMARQFGNRMGEGEAHLSMALVHTASAPPDYVAAEEEFAQAEKCLRECEARTALAPALRLHGEMRLKTGDAAGAQPLLQEARSLFGYMGRKDDVEAIDVLLEKAQAAESAAGSTVQSPN